MAYYNNYGYNTSVFERLKELGVFDILVPFILIFTLVFAILQKTKILGEHSKNFNMVIALVMGLSVVVPHVLFGVAYVSDDPSTSYLTNGLPDTVNIINKALPNVSVILVAVLMVLLIFGIWGSKVKLGSNNLSGIIALFAFAAVVYIFGSAAGWWHLPEWAEPWFDEDTRALVVTILVFAIVIWFITKDDGHQEHKEDAFGKFFGSILDSGNNGGGGHR